MTTSETSPDLFPLLSRGKHRRPRKGACFMELASYLAGERWSDHPRCTHPLLATMARLVNDQTSDEHRQRLSVLIPSVIGLVSDDLRWDATIARRAALAALPVAAGDRQRSLAVGVLACDRVLDELDGASAARAEESRATLALVPDARRWAYEFAGELGLSSKGFRSSGAPSIVLSGVIGLARACISDPDERLYDLLAGTIDACRALAPEEPPVVGAPEGDHLAIGIP